MLLSFPCKENEFGKMSAISRFGKDPQSFGQKQPFLAPMLLLAEGTDALDKWIGKGGNLAGQGTILSTSS